jgi:hypothetical protein
MTSPTGGPQGGQKRQFTHPLKGVMDDGRHPWVWAELDTAEANMLCGLLDAFVHFYNRESVTDRSELIPGCWRAHPRLMHELPVLYWQWFSCHHHPKAELGAAGVYYSKILPDFQERLESLIGMGATMCRKGEHSTAAGDNEVGPGRMIADQVLSGPGDDTQFIDHAVNAFRM